MKIDTEKMKAMCEHCRSKEEYEVFIRETDEDIDNIRFTYNEEYAVCRKCKNEIYVGEIHDRNLYNYNEAYKKSVGLITINEIEEILEKYNIGKKPLSILLGWGENTIIRYLKGDFPNKKYSEVLSSILKSPDYMYMLLEENKSNITSKAYDKCKSRVIEYLSNTELSIDSIAKYIVSKRDVTPKALQKILYFIQGFSLAFNDKLMFDNIPQAWVHGPVYPEIYNYYSDFKYNIIDEIEVEEDLNIEENDKVLIDVILKYFSRYNGNILEEITHIEKPWMEARIGLTKNQASKNPIDLISIDNYFKQVKDKYNMINYYDIKQYLDDMIDKIELN